jgi:hypothetical protein
LIEVTALDRQSRPACTRAPRVDQVAQPHQGSELLGGCAHGAPEPLLEWTPADAQLARQLHDAQRTVCATDRCHGGIGHQVGSAGTQARQQELLEMADPTPMIGGTGNALLEPLGGARSSSASVVPPTSR